MQDGDAFLLNHPYDGGTHLPDITLAVPVLADGRGAPGARAHAHVVRADGTREELPSKKMIVLHPGDQLWEYIAGGAGYGDPLDRDPAAVLADLLDGKITAAAATTEYGVVLVPDGTAVDEEQTKDARAARRRT
jgi:N-methylhydantoinase B